MQQDFRYGIAKNGDGRIHSLVKVQSFDLFEILVMEHKLIPEWVKGLKHLQDVFNRSVLDTRVIISTDSGYNRFDVIPISIMERREISHLIRVIPPWIIEEMKEVGAEIITDDRVLKFNAQFEELKRVVVFLTDISMSLGDKATKVADSETEYRSYGSTHVSKKALDDLRETIKSLNAMDFDAEVAKVDVESAIKRLAGE